MGLFRQKNPMYLSKEGLEIFIVCIHIHIILTLLKSETEHVCVNQGICLYTHIYIYTYVCIYIYMYKYVCVYIHTYICVYTIVTLLKSATEHVCMYQSFACLYVHMYICM